MSIKYSTEKKNMITIMHIVTVPETIKFLEGHISMQASAGYDVHVISSGAERLNGCTRILKCTFHDIRMKRNIDLLKDARSFLNITKKIREVSPGIIHCHTPKASMLGIISAKIIRVPIIIYHIHGIRYLTLKGPLKFLLKYCEKILCYFATQIISVSKSNMELLIREGLCNKEKISVLVKGSACGVDTEVMFNPDKLKKKDVRLKLQIPENAFVIGTVGRIVKDKGIEEMYGAWETIKNKIDFSYWLCVGEFEGENSICEKIKNKMINDGRIKLVGFQESVASCYCALDLFIMPSHREGFGVSTIEASSMKIPVIVTDIPGSVDAMMNNITGTVVGLFTKNELINAVLKYADNPQLAKKHGHNGRKFVKKNFQPINIQNELINVYKSLLKNRKN